MQPSLSLNPTILRGYQYDALTWLRYAFAAGARRVVLSSPTGSGKSLVGVAVVEAALARGKRVLFVVDRIILVNQFSEQLAKAHIVHGRLQGDTSEHIDAPVLVASIHTIARRGIPQDRDLIVLDECHHATTKSYTQLLATAKVPVLGLTATSFARGLGRYNAAIGGPVFEQVVVAATIRDLINDGHLVDIKCYAPEEPNLDGLKIVAGDFAEAELAARVDTSALRGGIVHHWLELAGGARTAVFCVSIAHSQHVTAQFLAAGVAAEHLDAYTSDEDRKAILDRLAAGTTRVVSNCSVLAEGYDNPALECVVLARPTRSLVRLVQSVGRALRPFPGKERALILDHSGSLRRFPWLTDDLPTALDTGKRATSSAKHAAEEALPCVCAECHFVKPPGVWVCPNCGNVPVKRSKVVVAKGKLVEYRQKPRQDTWSELLWLQANKGYSAGRIAHLFKDLYGAYPDGLLRDTLQPSAALLRFITYRNMRYAKGIVKNRQTTARLI